MRVGPPPPLDPLQLCAFPLGFLLIRDRQDKLGGVLRLRGRTRHAQDLARPAIQRVEADDEGAFARGAVGAEAGVFRIREKVGGGDVVGGGPARVEPVGGFVARASEELGDALYAGRVSERADRR